MKASSTMNRLHNRSAFDRVYVMAFVIAAAFTTLSGTIGCTDGPMFQMKKLSPWHQREWRRDRDLGPTYSMRLKELELLRGQLPSYPENEQQRWGEVLEQIVSHDTSPEMRAQAARALALVRTDASVRGLDAASTDKVEKVRLAVCDAWGIRGDERARDMLLSMAQTDDSDDVRQAALASLGKFNDPEVRTLLVEALDHKNPAIQQQAVVSLKAITGRNYGGDFEAWKRYVSGEEVQEPTAPSFTARVMDAMPSWK